jgi:hypothetical protein
MDDTAKPVEKNVFLLGLRHVENGKRRERGAVGGMGSEQGLESNRAPMRQTENRLKAAVDANVAKPADNVGTMKLDKRFDMVERQPGGQRV